MATMAGFTSGSASDLSLLPVGNFVTSEGRALYMQAIESSIGFNSYICVDIDSGAELRRRRYQIELTDVEFVTGFEKQRNSC